MPGAGHLPPDPLGLKSVQLGASHLPRHNKTLQLGTSLQDTSRQSHQVSNQCSADKVLDTFLTIPRCCSHRPAWKTYSSSSRRSAISAACGLTPSSPCQGTTYRNQSAGQLSPVPPGQLSVQLLLDTLLTTPRCYSPTPACRTPPSSPSRFATDVPW